MSIKNSMVNNLFFLSGDKLKSKINLIFAIQKAFLSIMQNETEKSNTLVSKSLPMKPTIFISFLFSMSKAGRYVLSNER